MVKTSESHFLNALLGDVYDIAHADGDGRIRHRALTLALLRRLEDAGMCENPQPAFFRLERGSIAAEVHGYATDSEDDVLTLYYVIDATDNVALGDPCEVVATSKADVDRGVRRLAAFVKLASTDRHAIEDSLPAAELAALIKDSVPANVRIELQVITTGRLTDKAAASRDSTGATIEIADITRLSRVCGAGRTGTTDIDFTLDHGGPLPCLVAPATGDGLQVLLACVPGSVLADIYNTYRSSLLERNVRTFLQFTGKVNKGIRQTLLTEPERFLPYNNGLSATARDVRLSRLSDRTGQIEAAMDFQIVNGGQTTASIAAAVRRDGADLSAVMVPMKLTVVPSDRIDELVPKISRYANTQNRVQDSDFSANEPWHVGMERHSRDCWTAPRPDAPRGTRWFYERSRGQYQDELGAAGTVAGRRRFRAENPSNQKVTKTEVAKYLSSWDQYPHIVSRGAQKCFQDFMVRLGADARRTPAAGEFQRTIALAMLFRRAERLHGELDYQGFRAQVVTYTIAALSRLTGRSLPADQMWRTQTIPDDFESSLRIVMTGVRHIVTNPPPKYRNVTEWTKRPECWQKTVEADFDVPVSCHKALGSSGQVQSAPGSPSVVESDEELAMIDAVSAVPSPVWFAVAKWAKDTDSLKPWQRQIAFSIGQLPGRRRRPSVKQARQGRKLLIEAVRLGFSDRELRPEQVRDLEASEA